MPLKNSKSIFLKMVKLILKFTGNINKKNSQGNLQKKKKR